MKRHKRHRAVEADLREAARWYEAAVPGLGRDLVDAVERAVGQILARPRTWPRAPGAPRDLDLRRYVLERFPYYVAYLLTAGDDVIVLAVAHMRRRPLFWLRRSAPKKTRPKR